MKTALTREKAIGLLREYNKEPFHVLHGLTVGGVLKWYARELGYGDEADFWEICGILHDIDFEQYPEEHCLAAPRLLREGGAEAEGIHAVCSHCYGHHPEITASPDHEMEKVLYAADELTGLIGAAAKMRPSRSCQDMEVSSLKKKFKDKRFAAGCSRDIIAQGAEQLGWDLAELMERTILAMRSCEESVQAEMEAMGLEA